MRNSLKTTYGALRAIVAAGILAAPFALVPAAAHAQSAPIPAGAAYSCDFENGYCDFLEQSKLGDAPGATRRSSILNTARNGSFGVRLHTEPGDNSVHGSGTWERDDLEKAPDPSYCNQGQEEWWAASVMFPSDYSFPAPGQGGVILDFHHNADSGVPPFGLEVRGESGMRISGYGGPSLNGGQYRVQIADPWGAVNNVTHNVWYDFVFHIKWSSGGDGFSEAWLNGKKVLSYSGATAYSGISCYLKLANYHDATGQPSSIIFDRIVRGTSAASVAIGALEGVNGAAAPASTSVATTTSPPAPPAPPATTGSGSSSGSGSGSPSSATMDSSSYASAAGSSVTFTARIMGNAGTPTGSVSFASDGGTIAGCSSVPLSGGAAQCTTSALSGGQHKIAGSYSGDSAYGGAQAGPITQTVTGGASSNVTSSLPTSFGMDSSSYSAAVGEGVTFTATIPGNGGSVAFADNGTPIAGCSSVGVSSNGAATCTTSALAAGTHAITGAYSGSGSYAAGVAGPITQTVAAKSGVTTGAASVNVQGLWWGGLPESGWGVNVAQQGAIVFATWFTYDSQGRGQWLVMSDGALTGTNTYSGTLYRTTGPALSGGSFDASKVSATAVGNATLAFTDANNGTFTATVDGVTVRKAITRQVFDAAMPTCTEGGTQGGAANFQDLWWRVNGTESGWGLNLTHQGDTMFMTWFTYDASGNGMWLVASDVKKNADGSYAGTLYQTTGPSFDSASWDASKVTKTAVGSVAFSFSDASHGTFSYNVNGVSGSKPITRQLFSTPATVCRSA